MKSLFKVILFLFVLFMYSSVCQHAVLFWYDALPRYIAGIVYIFILPISLSIVFIYVLKWLDVLIHTPTLPTHNYAMSVGIIGATMWLGIIGLVASDALKYAELQKYPVMHEMRYADSAEYSKASYFSLTGSGVIMQYAHTYVTTSTPTKSTGQRTHWHHYVVPIVPKGWNPDMPVKIWIGIIGTSLEINTEKLLTSDLIENPEGLIIRDPYDVPNLKESAEKCALKYGLKISDSPIFILPSPDFEKSSRNWGQSFKIAVGLNYLFFVILPFILVHLYIFKRK